MQNRRLDVAVLEKIFLETVKPVTVKEMRFALYGKIDDSVLEIVGRGVGENGEPCFFWKAKGRYYLDDSTFGPVVDIETLKYDPALGLYDPRTKTS